MKKTGLILFFAIIMFHKTFAQQMPISNIFHNPTIEKSGKYVKGNPYQKDFLLFMDMIRTTHPAFWGSSKDFPFDLEDITERNYVNLKACESLDEFRLTLQSVMAKLHDGHSFISLPDYSAMKFYPMNIVTYGGKFYIRVIDKDFDAILGEEIEAINNIPIDNIISDFIQFVSGNNISETQQRVTEYILYPFMWQHFTYKRDDNAILVKGKSGKEVLIKAKLKKEIIPSVVTQLNTENITKFNDQLFSYRLLEQEKIAYFQFNTCMDYNSAKFHINMNIKNDSDKEKAMQEIAVYPKFDEFLEKMFQELRDKQISTLVVDMRYNSGGNSELCKQLLSYLYPIDSLNTGKEATRISMLMEQQYPDIVENYRKILMKQNKKLIYGNLYDSDDFRIEDNEDNLLKEYFVYNHDNSKIFTGKTCFLQSKETYSSAGLLMVWVKDNKIGSIVGEKSIYHPCEYGDILMWQLPDTKLTGGLSHRYFYRPDSAKCYEPHLMPDILIETTFEDWKQNTDSVWNWILNNQ